MTDKEKLKALLDEWEVPYRERVEPVLESGKPTDVAYQVVSVGSDPDNPFTDEASPKVDGYLGFFIEFDFDKDGKFVKMGAWE